jgi:hypothetical protein
MTAHENIRDWELIVRWLTGHTQLVHAHTPYVHTRVSNRDQQTSAAVLPTQMAGCFMHYREKAWIQARSRAF